MVKDGSLIVRHRSCAQTSVTRARGFPRVAHTSAHRVAPTSPFMSATVKKPGHPMDRTRWQKRCCTCSWGAYMKGNVCATRDPRGLDLRPGTHIMIGTENGGRSAPPRCAIRSWFAEREAADLTQRRFALRLLHPGGAIRGCQMARWRLECKIAVANGLWDVYCCGSGCQNGNHG
jgi:hypothetical protein